MKVAILHVTRTKLSNDYHALLTNETKNVIMQYVDNSLPNKVENVKVSNYFINTGFTWDQMKEVVDEINQKKFDGFLLCITASCSKLPLFNKNFLDFLHQGLKKTPICNLIYTGSHVSFFMRGINPANYGTKATLQTAVDA